MTSRDSAARSLAELPSASVTVYPDGPLVVRGNFAIKHVDGTDIPSGTTVALCRCGRSAVKPLCDGSHKNARRRVEPRNTASDTVRGSSARDGSGSC